MIVTLSITRSSRGSKKWSTFSFSLKKLPNHVLPDLASATITKNGPPVLCRGGEY